MSLHAPVTLRAGRVTLRPWRDDDLEPFAAMNADPQVMQHFLAPLTRAQSDAFAARARLHVEQFGHGLWALEVAGQPFAGFVGLSAVPFELPVPGLAPDPREIGWRLVRAVWGQGLASEAARLVLDHAWQVMRLRQVVSFTALGNQPSRRVMERIGLTQRAQFDHPRIAAGHPLCAHVLYAAEAP